jgi:hypothetical protein
VVWGRPPSAGHATTAATGEAACRFRWPNKSILLSATTESRTGIPAVAGIDPRHLLIDVEPGDNLMHIVKASRPKG